MAHTCTAQIAAWLAVMAVAIHGKVPLYVVMRMDDTQPQYEATTQVIARDVDFFCPAFLFNFDH